MGRDNFSFFNIIFINKAPAQVHIRPPLWWGVGRHCAGGCAGPYHQAGLS